MAQECFVKDGNRRLYPRCIRASFKNNSVKHSIKRHLRHHWADYVVTPLKQYDILSADAASLPRENIYRKHQDKVALQVH